MVSKAYDWEGGAKLEAHTKKKLAILKEYFRKYLITRCQMPQQKRFRLAIVDGFAGGGLYKCGSYGSPLIFVDTLIQTAKEINLHRLKNGIGPIEIECLLLLNDNDISVINLLKKNITPLMAGVKETSENVHIEIEYSSDSFEKKYNDIKLRLRTAKCNNVFFNLDQCGYSHVTTTIIRDIITSWRSAEVFLTFMIASMLTFLSQEKATSGVPLEPEMQEKISALLNESGANYSKKMFLADAEKIVFAYLKDCAHYVSPFSINNPDGWQYWLMHFASSHKARQVYNNVLHQDEATQAHFGRAGLNMLSYNPKNDGQLYLFDGDSRESAKKDLYDDIPRLIASSGDVLGVEAFYKTAYSETPAHSDDIHEMIIKNPDVEVITEAGGKRQKPHTIQIGDTLKLKNQRSFFFMFSGETGRN